MGKAGGGRVDVRLTIDEACLLRETARWAGRCWVVEESRATLLEAEAQLTRVIERLQRQANADEGG